MDVLLMIAKRDNLQGFGFFCVHELSAPTLSHPGGEDVCQLVGVRMVLDYGNHSYQDLRFPSVVEFSVFSVLLANV